MRANLEFFRVERSPPPVQRWAPEIGYWREGGGFRERERERERERPFGRSSHHGHHPHAGCGQSPGPGTERVPVCANDVVHYVGVDEGFR